MNTPGEELDDESEYDKLMADGSFKKISDFIKYQTDVHIQRSNGEWQMSKVIGLSVNNNIVVEFTDSISGSRKSKKIPIRQLLEWQERSIN